MLPHTNSFFPHKIRLPGILRNAASYLAGTWQKAAWQSVCTISLIWVMHSSDFFFLHPPYQIFLKTSKVILSTPAPVSRLFYNKIYTLTGQKIILCWNYCSICKNYLILIMPSFLFLLCIAEIYDAFHEAARFPVTTETGRVHPGSVSAGKIHTMGCF